MRLLVSTTRKHTTCILDTWANTDGTRKWSEGLLYAHIMKNEAFSRVTQCRPHKAMFDSPKEVGFKASCLPYANILNLQTEEEFAAIPTSVEQSGEMPDTLKEQILKLMKTSIRRKNLATSLAL